VSETPRMDAVMRDIESLGYGTPEYHEAMWFLLSIMARRQFAIADRIRADRRKRERAAATREANRQKALDDFCCCSRCPRWCVRERPDCVS